MKLVEKEMTNSVIDKKNLGQEKTKNEIMKIKT